jgi:hypothetical protein
LSGMFLATTVNLRVTGLPGTAKIPPPTPALLRVTWLNLMVSGPPAAGPLLVMVASMIPPPCPEAVLRLKFSTAVPTGPVPSVPEAMPPPALIIPPADALPVIRLWFRISVPSRLKMPPPGPGVFPR